MKLRTLALQVIGEGDLQDLTVLPCLWPVWTREILFIPAGNELLRVKSYEIHVFQIEP